MAKTQTQNKTQEIHSTTSHPHKSEIQVTETRPWGSFTTLEEGFGYKIKRIEVNPGHRLSLQMHHHRSEHWIVVSGTAKVVCGDEEKNISGKSVNLCASMHRPPFRKSGGY